MPRGALAARLSLTDILEEAALEIEASVGDEAPEDDTPIWTPHPGPQTAAYESQADELFYGGAAGGGKTDLSLGLALTKHRNSIIFRREFAQFRGSEGAWDRAKLIVAPLGPRAKTNDSSFTIRIPGRSLEFGATKTLDDRLKYKGRPHDLKLFDELPEFMEMQYRFLIGWLRTTHVGQRLRVVGTGNPPTSAEGEWVNRYWAPWLDPTHPNPALPGELRWFISTDDGDVEVPDGKVYQHKGRWIKPRSRTFIPARVEDNPDYMRTGYADVLDNLPEPLRSQMRDGNFQATGVDDPWQVCPTTWIEAAMRRWRPDGAPCGMSSLGVDPSRGGIDQFVLAPRHGHWFAQLIKHSAKSAPDGAAGAALIFAALRGDTSVPVQIDVIGTAGGSVYDHTRELGLFAIAMNGSERTDARDKSGKLGFANKRAEWHWKMREALDPNSGNELALPPDPQLKSDLAAPRWQPTPRGVLVERKEDVKARLGRSPDCGEAVIYATNDERPVEEPHIPLVLY